MAKKQDPRLAEIAEFIKKYHAEEQVIEEDEKSQKTQQIPEEVATADQNPMEKPRRLPTILFYGILIGIVVVVYLNFGNEVDPTTGQPKPRNFLGYSIHTVMTESMQSIFPQGSLLISKYIDPQEIQIGDDITYLQKDSSSITHRVMEVHENYEDSGVRAFKTKGTDNDRADADLILAPNVQGVVVYHIPEAGNILRYIQTNIILVAGIVAVFIVLICTLLYLIRNRRR